MLISAEGTHINFLSVIVEGRRETDGVGEYVVLEIHGVVTDTAVDAQDAIDIGLKLKHR